LETFCLERTSVDRVDHTFGIVPTVFHATRSNQTFHFDIAINGFGFKVATKSRFRIELEHWHAQFAAIANHDRLIVGDEFREKAEAKEHRENDQRPKCPAVAFEVAPATLIERGKCHLN